MRSSLSRVAAIAVAGLLVIACSTVSSPATTTTQRPGVTPLPVRPTVEPSSAIPSPVPITSPVGSLPHSPGPGGFITPFPSGAGTVWTGLRWRRLAPDDPLAHVRSVSSWRAGYVAVGDPGATSDSARTPVWTSSDGATWDLLGADALGPTTMVVGMAASADGIVALTQQSAMSPCFGDATYTNCWNLTGPTQAWTSSDGTRWTAHPAPQIELGAMTSTVWASRILQGGSANHVLSMWLAGSPLRISRDGIAWETVSLEAFPSGWDMGDIVATPSGFIAVGQSTTRTLSLRSLDGQAWTSHEMSSTVTGNGRLVSGADGLIAMALQYHGQGDEGETVSTAGTWIWWSTLDGRTWNTLPKYPPLGAQLGPDAQECFDACPNGILVGNGERMIAYRGLGEHEGWTSADGRSWQHLVFEGSHPTGEPGHSDLSSVVVMPFGVMLHNLDGSTWFGTPIT